MNNQPNTGDIATCKHCGAEIWYDGVVWRHRNTFPRHFAEPVTATNPASTPQPHLTAILQQPVQYQVEPDGDALWA